MLPFLKIFVMFKMRLCYDKETFKENAVENIAIRCSNCGETAGLSVKNANTNCNSVKTIVKHVLTNKEYVNIAE